MNTPQPAAFAFQLTADLRAFALVCEDVLGIATREHQALNHPGDYQAFDFFRSRKDLLVRLDQSLINIRKWRQVWQQCDPGERSRHPEIKNLFQMLQDLVVRILQLDRENQQALLRRGLVPARHLPPAASQQPNFVAGLYRRHS